MGGPLLLHRHAEVEASCGWFCGALISTDAMANLLQGSEDVAPAANLTSIMQYGIIVVSTLPLMVVFPAAQKCFSRGVMIGAIRAEKHRC